MRNSIPLIRNIRLKESGTEFHILENKTPDMMLKRLRRDIEEIAQKRRKDLIGYAVVSWSRDGATSSCLSVCDGRWVGMDEAPDFVRNALLLLAAQED